MCGNRKEGKRIDGSSTFIETGPIGSSDFDLLLFPANGNNHKETELGPNKTSESIVSAAGSVFSPKSCEELLFCVHTTFVLLPAAVADV